MQHECDWVPSHGKYPEWKPSGCPSADHWRSLNKRADSEAGSHLDGAKRRLYPIGKKLEVASKWTVAALATLAASSKRLLQAHGLAAIPEEVPAEAGVHDQVGSDAESMGRTGDWQKVVDDKGSNGSASGISQPTSSDDGILSDSTWPEETD